MQSPHRETGQLQARGARQKPEHKLVTSTTGRRRTSPPDTATDHKRRSSPCRMPSVHRPQRNALPWSRMFAGSGLEYFATCMIAVDSGLVCSLHVGHRRLQRGAGRLPIIIVVGRRRRRLEGCLWRFALTNRRAHADIFATSVWPTTPPPTDADEHVRAVALGARAGWAWPPTCAKAARADPPA